MQHNKLYLFKNDIPKHIGQFRGRLFTVTYVSEEDNAIDVIMLDDFTEWCFTFQELHYYCKEAQCIATN